MEHAKAILNIEIPLVLLITASITKLGSYANRLSAMDTISFHVIFDTLA
jgi:hypothetical protein